MFDAPRSDRVVRWCTAANVLLTAKAFWSTAWAGSRTDRPRFCARPLRAVSEVWRSGDATDAAFLPLMMVFNWSAYVATYSGTTSTVPRSSEDWKISLDDTSVTGAVKPAFFSNSAYICARSRLSVKPADATATVPE